MRRTKTVLGVVAVMAAMLVAFAAPAMADDWDWNDDRHDSNRWWWDWNDDRHDNDRWWDNRFDNGFFFGGDEIDQDFDQEAESGDVDQSFDVSSTGDNSNQTVGTQGVANTGNAQNQIGVFQIGSEADDFEFDEVGSSIEVSPTNRTASDQEVGQAASASD